MGRFLNIVVIVILILVSALTIYISFWYFGSGEMGEGIFEMYGTVKYIGLEGGFYGIIGDDGGRYQPLNLPEEYRVDGLRIWFKAKIREDVATIYMWGTPIEILEVKALGD